MTRIALGVQYEGSHWQGYQTQPHGKTVQDSLEAALHQFGRHTFDTTCAGRTDTGVHALEQVVHFDTDLVRSMYSWVNGVNAFLPPSIVVRWAHEVPEQLDGREFHARFAARARTYHYILYNNPVRSPIFNRRAGWVFRRLDEERMRTAAQYLLGTHDFSAFRASHCQAKTPIKDMYEINIVRQGDFITFTLRASAFLHHMVRNIVGSMIYVGTGAKPIEWMNEVLLSGNRSLAAPTFMPDGLYLAHIDYDPRWGLPQEKQTNLGFF
mgnify:CR=1 FL=1